jgi:hypothetical protein
VRHAIIASSLRDADVPQLTSAAEQFLTSQPWCGRVLHVTPVFALVGTVAVFRCALIPRSPEADVMVWVVVGDLPAAIITHEPGDSWQDALAGYVTEMTYWVDAVRSGNPIDRNIIPVDLLPTRENADLLASRLEFLRTRLVDVDPDSVKPGV